MSFSAPSGSLAFFLIGFLLIALGVAFVLIPLVGANGFLSKANVPWILLYVYNKGGFYFATSPILVILSLATLLVFFLRR